MTQITYRKETPMKGGLLVVLAFGLFLACVQLGWAVEPNAEQAKAAAEIQKIGGTVTFDEQSPAKPMIGVDLNHRKVTDAGLEHLSGLIQLRTLNLGHTKITDAGLDDPGLTRDAVSIAKVSVTTSSRYRGGP